ncbi:histidine kinase dimerization/phosphoacceptor domain -containing protein [Spirosoma sp. SC4-14]|uniref:histidine kinase dimerization/phosphoacceptor domain -containing protein n=1 Tax=Spirosoma sp. SC4-14 TaxID=3128900 RepID=UPI0030D43B70
MFWSNPRSVCLLVLLSMALGQSRAQKAIHLSLNEKRLQNAQQTEQKALRENDSLLLAEAWYLYGKTHAFAGDYAASQRYFLKSLGIQERRGDSFELGRLYVRLYENESRQNDMDDALHYVRQSLQVFQRIHSDEGLLRAYGALGQAYEIVWDGQWQHDNVKSDSILACYNAVRTLGHRLNDTLAIAEADLLVGQFLTRTQNPKSITYLEKALHLYSLKHKPGIQINTMVHLATAYRLTGKPERAYAILQQAETLYKQANMNELDYLIGMEREFVDYYETTGQWAKAYQRLKKLSQLEKTMLLEDRNGAVSRINMEYESEKKESLLKSQKRELTLQAATLQTQQRFTLAVSALLMMTIGMSIVFFRLYRKNQRISRQNAELVKEQNHRVKNNLQIVSSLLNLQAKRLSDATAKKAVEESQLRVQSMAILHRRLYDGDKLAQVRLDEFIEELITGILHTYGFTHAEHHFSIDKIDLTADKAIPLGLIINELVTNSCKYAFPGNKDPLLWVSCRKTGSRIQLVVADNGPGLTKTDQPALEPMTRNATKMKTFGMTLIQSQVEQLDGVGIFNTNDRYTATGAVFTLEFTV